jgi:phosphoribosylanthranilate isomerase
MPVKVKICGITNVSDAIAAVEAQVDALGFIFYEGSPRYVAISAAAQIMREIPKLIIKVGVFVNAPAEQISAAIEQCALNVLQFHGDEPPEFCLQFGLMSMKAFRVRDAESLQRLLAYKTDAWLLDAYAPNQLGGTGHTFNWELAVNARKWGRPIFLAGGLTPANVAQAVEYVSPYAVDVSSGVEIAPGRKDHQKMRAFVTAAKGAGQGP